MLKKYRVVIIAILAILPLLIGMSVEPSQYIQHNASSWLVVRFGIVLPLSIVLGLLTYYGTQIGAGLREIKGDIKSIKSDAAQSSNVSDFLDRVSGLTWITWWVICFQIMATFYIADWCPTGF